MSSKELSYGGIITKTKAMNSYLLKDQDYQKMLSLDSVSEIISYLKKHKGYSDIFATTDNQYHRGQIEHILFQAVYRDFTKLYQFADISQRKVLKILFYRYEVNIIKIVLHGVVHKDDIVDLSEFQEFFDKHSEVNLAQLKTAENIEDFIQKMANTKYYAQLKEVQKNQDATIFDYEMQLDISYFMFIWKLRKKLLFGEELQLFTRLLGQQIDILNIIWIYRLKNYYVVDRSRMQQYIIPIHHNLTSNQVQGLMDAVNTDEFVNIIKSTPYSKDFIKDNTMDSDLEAVYGRKITHNYLKGKHFKPMSIIPIQFYLYLKELEVDKITTTLECIRYNLNPEEGMKMVLNQ